MNRFRNRRRGISTVVGGIFMVLLMVGAVNLTVWAMQQQNAVTQTIIAKTNSNLNKLNERISITDLRISNNKLNITVTNAGGTLANLTSLYVINQTSSSQYRYNLNTLVDGRNSVSNIGQNLAFTAKTSTKYSVKVVSQNGNTATATYYPLSQISLPMALYAIPPTVNPLDNITLLYTVTNNVTGSGGALTVSPTLSSFLSCSPPGPNCQLTPVVSPSGSTTLVQGTTALFKWVFTVNAPDQTVLTFNASLAGAKTGNFVLEKAKVQLVAASQTSFQSDELVSSTLVQRPEIFAMFPNPFGNSAQKGIWGIAVANPTQQPMNVTKIVITITSPRGQSNDKIFDSGGGDDCSPSTINPTGSNYWSCPGVNMLQWRNPAGLLINGPSAMAFMASVNPGSLASTTDLYAYNIDITVFTNMGQFGKSGYSGSMRNAAGAMPNVYLSTVANSTSTANMVGNYTGFKAGTTQTFNAVLANLDTTGANQINSGARLVIDVPKSFGNVQILSSTDFTVTGPTLYSDGSWQIIGSLKHALTGVSPNAARTIQFSASVLSTVETKVYVMYVLGDGDSQGATAFPIGPIAEVPVQVTP